MFDDKESVKPSKVVQLESVEDGRRVEAAGGQVLRKKCDDLSREVAALKEKHANQAELIRRLEATCANFEESEEYLKDLAGNEGAASRPGEPAVPRSL